MGVKLVAGIALPLIFASAPAMAFGLLSLITSIAGVAVGAAGGTALSSSGVGPAGQPGATPFSPAPIAGHNDRTAWATTGSGALDSLLPSGRRGLSQSAVQVRDLGWVYGSPETLKRLGRPLRRKPGVDRRTVQLCRDAIAHTVAADGAVQVDAASAGRSSHRSGHTFSPLTARAIYRLPSGYEAKQATVLCRTDRAGAAVLIR